MMPRPSLLLPILVSSALSSHAAVFDFSETGSTSGNNSQGASGNVNVSDASVPSTTATIDGVALSLTALSTSGAAEIGANGQGFGVSTDNESGANETRLEGDKGESIQFSFGQDVLLDSLRFGNFSNGETAVLSFVSGVNPFTSGSSLSITGDGNQGPAYDILLSSDPIVTGGISIIQANTVLELTISGGGNDVLLNEFSVSPTLQASIVTTPPTPVLTENPNPATNVGITIVAAGNQKGQSFSLGAPATIGSFVFESGGVATPGDFKIALHQAMDGIPWLLDPIVSGIASLPSGLVAGDRFQITLPTAVELKRGSYIITLEGLGSTSFPLRFSEDPLYPTGAGARNNSALGWRPLNNPDADLLFAVIGTQEASPPVPTGKPNIVFILADDLGWTDIQCGPTGPNVINGTNHGTSFYQTPNLARLATEGLSFTHTFVHPNCAPTRAALLSGQYPSRSGNGVYHVDSLNRGGSGTTYLGPSQNEDIPVAHVISPEALQEAGYVTAHLGKYHVANHETGLASMPENQGFDFNFGGKENGNPGNFFASSGVWNTAIGPGLASYAAPYDQSYIDTVLKAPPSNPLNDRASNYPLIFPQEKPNDPDVLGNDNKHLTDAMGDAATAFIRDHTTGNLADRPLYMQVHFYAVHTPIQDRPDLTTKYATGITPSATHDNVDYAGLVEGMDQNIGRILDRLDDPNGDGDPSDSIADNTLIVFISDNGGHIGPTDNDPLRHRKGSFWNGGLRVPMILRQPGTVPAASQTDTLVHAVDIYPTLLEHAGVSMPAGITFDGESFAAHMTDPVGTPRKRSPIFYHFPGYLDQRARPVDVAIARIDGEDYKLIYNYDLTYTGNPSSTEDQQEGLDPLGDPWQLFKFSSDISETTDLIDGSYSNHLLYGDIADQMASQMDDWLTQPDPDWEAHKLTLRSTGAEVDYPGPDVADVVVPFGQTFHITASSVDLSAKTVTLTWNSEAGFSYDIEVSDGLGSWSPLATDVPSGGASTTAADLADPGISLPGRRFYRVVLTP
ncbi:sulfatase [Haloferula rosea]|uniref:Sulfatase n=1 Tax=Haloferula rosea TaxID=490093 RepID=A0A934R5D4_9BACT|nr:sulfatase [Haloferula rosea]MBK1825614.1 sulfatase [Haloferula rosea]